MRRPTSSRPRTPSGCRATAEPSASRICPLIAPMRRCSSVASILVAISDMRWFTTACTPSSMLSEPKTRTFCTSSARMVSSSAMCGTTSERAFLLLVVFWIAGAPRAVVSTRLRLPAPSSIRIGLQAGSHPGGAQDLRNSAGFRRSSATVVRTANPNSRSVASEVSGGAPPYQYSSKKDPDVLNRRSMTLAVLTSISDQFHLLLPSITLRRR